MRARQCAVANAVPRRRHSAQDGWLRDRNSARSGSRFIAGHCNRRAIGAEDWRNAVWLPRRGAVRHCRRSAAPRTGAARVRAGALAQYGDLSGISVDAELSCNGGRFRENLLFTHRGLSGPAILQISSYWDGRTPLSINLLPGEDAAKWLTTQTASQAQLPTLLAQRLPKRVAQQWCAAHGVAMPAKQLGESRLRDVAAQLNDWRVLPSGTLGYQKAEVTCGGVATSGLSSKTMGAAEVPGLYFIGEVVDVTDGSGATTSNGRGRRAMRPARLSDGNWAGDLVAGAPPGLACTTSR